MVLVVMFIVTAGAFFSFVVQSGKKEVFAYVKYFKQYTVSFPRTTVSRLSRKAYATLGYVV